MVQRPKPKDQSSNSQLTTTTNEHMFESEDQTDRAIVIIMMLAKLYIVLELSPETCPLCRKVFSHDNDCPILLAWSLLDNEQQQDARAAIRALALSIGCDDSFADPVAH